MLNLYIKIHRGIAGLSYE